MTALPDDETSAVQALARATPSPTDLPFDWMRLVVHTRPGTATQQQRAHLARVQQCQQDVMMWLDQFHLPLDHAEASVVFAAGASPLSWTPMQTHLLTRLIAWVYTFDTWMDAPTLRAAGDEPTALMLVDAGLRAIRHVVTHQVPLLVWPQAGIPYPRESHTLAPFPSAYAQLGSALADLFSVAQTHWQEMELPQIRWRATLLCSELARCLLTMRQEFQWDCQARTAGMQRLPSLAHYLLTAQRSIGVYLICALAVSFDHAPHTPWQAALPALSAGGRIARLANDLHLLTRDLREAHVTAAVVAWQEQHQTHQKDWPAEAELASAQIVVCQALDHALAQFARAEPLLPESSLAHVLRHIVAFALAIYGDGRAYRAVPDVSAAFSPSPQPADR